MTQSQGRAAVRADQLQLTVAINVVVNGGEAEPVAFSLPAAAERRPAAPTERFTKIDSQGKDLPRDADAWAAVRDNRTGLEWSADNVSEGRVDWKAADKACSSLSLARAEDWRLPALDELFSLVDHSRHEPAIDVDFFPNTESSWYWTASPCAWSPSDLAWLVGFSYGYVYSLPRYSDAFVRAVRGGVPAGQ